MSKKLAIYTVRNRIIFLKIVPQLRLKNMIKKILILPIFFLISGCSFEPSESEIKQAVQDSYSQGVSSVLSGKLGEVLLSSAGLKDIKLLSIDKIACSKISEKSYFCEYVVEYALKAEDGSLAEMFGINGKKKQVSKSKFLKTSKGWMIAEE